MKSVVLEIKNNKAAVLDDRGVVHAVRDRGYAIGQVLELSELEMKQNEVRSGADRKISGFTRAAAAVLAVVVIGGGVSAYAAPVSIVSLTGASEVEYSLNVFDRVVGVSTSGDRDEELGKEVRGMKISDAVDHTVTKFEDRIFDSGADRESGAVTIKVKGLKKGNKNLNEELEKKAREIESRRPESAPEKKDDESKPETISDNRDGSAEDKEYIHPGDSKTDERIVESVPGDMPEKEEAGKTDDQARSGDSFTKDENNNTEKRSIPNETYPAENDRLEDNFDLDAIPQETLNDPADPGASPETQDIMPDPGPHEDGGEGPKFEPEDIPSQEETPHPQHDEDVPPDEPDIGERGGDEPHGRDM